MMNRFAELIKQAAVDAVNASYPVQIMFGKIVGTGPLRVYVSQKMPSISGDLLVVTRTAARDGLDVGDKVVLLRAQGGQKFIVLDKEA